MIVDWEDGMSLQSFAAVVAWVLLVGPAFARAGDPKPAAVEEPMQKVQDLERQTKQHLADRDNDMLKRDCRGALELAGRLADEKLKARCLDTIGVILGASDDDDVRTEAIKAIADSREKSLYHFVTPYLKQPDKRIVPPLLLDAIECAGKLKADEAVLPLLDLEQNSDVYTVAVAAIKALSSYGDVKRRRVVILKTLVDDLRKGRDGVDPDARARYESLAGDVVTGCNKLTGRNHASPREWFELVEKYKTDLEVLFGDK